MSIYPLDNAHPLRHPLAMTTTSLSSRPPRKPARNRQPHRLDLYRLAVQQPWTMAHLLVNAYADFNPGRWPTRLREDFAGTAALAMAWVQRDHDHHALAIDHHGPTVRFALKRARQLGVDATRFTYRQGDVTTAGLPKADVIAALNFSINIYHDRQDLLAYFKHARKNLRARGLLVIDAFGGPGAQRISTQKRRVTPPTEEDIAPFDYLWEQKDIDPLTGRIDCRIHFKLKTGRRIDNAFVYPWRLWQVAELLDVLHDAGFGRLQVWCEDEQGQFGPTDRIGPREDFLGYILAGV